MVHARRFGLGYAWIPLVSAVIWFATILALLIIWLATGHPRYRNSEHRIVYVSDVGGKYQGLFIAGSVVTALFFVATLIADRALRHRNRLPAFTQSKEERFSLFSIIFGFIGAFALILLSSLNVFTHQGAHWAFTGIFVVGLGLSALMNALETHFMSRAYPALRRMRRSRIAKLVLVGFGILFAIIMVILMSVCNDAGGGENDPNDNGLKACNRQASAAAVFEWSIAFILAGFFATYVADMWYQDEPVPQIEREMRQEGLEPKITQPGNPAATAVQAVPIGEALA